jgi:HK97 family phage portal protein
MMLGTLFSTRRPSGIRASQGFSSWPPGDPRWYESLGTRSDAGIAINPEIALTIGVIYRAINVLAHAVATVPLVIFKNLGEGKQERAPDHPQYEMLHDSPNVWMTSFALRHLIVSRSILWGNFYAQLMPGRGGIGSLIPLEPSTTRVVDQLSEGRLLYVTQDKTESGGFQPERRLIQDDVFHVRGFSMDGKTGLPLTKFARNAMGLALAAEKHGSMFMRRGAQFSGLLTTPGSMEQPVREANEKAWNKAHGGLAGSGAVPLLEGGMEFKATSSTNRDSQWLEARDFQIAELGPRFLGVPGLLCGYPDKTATYASAQEMRQVFVDTGVMPLTDNIRAELNKNVVVGAPGEYYADFVLEGLLRADIKTRYESHRTAIMTGWESRNEVRRLEGLNPGPEALDEFFEPLNLGIAGEEPPEPKTVPGQRPGVPAPKGPQQPDDSEGDQGEGDQQQAAALTRLRAIAERQAQRLVRREIDAIAGSGGKLGAARRFAADAKGWGKWLDEFYAEHAKTVSESLRVPWDVAHAYAEGHRAALVASCAVVETFEAEAVPRLVALAIGG